MKSYKFSVSTSFFKRGDYVNQLYQQLLEQTYTNWEWIVTDDFSSEKNAEEELRRIASQDPRVKYIDQDFKQQLFYNPQIGCDGDIILQTDSDDIIAPTLLSHYNYWFNKRPDVYGISCSYTAKENIDYPSLVGKWVTESNYDISQFTTMDYGNGKIDTHGIPVYRIVGKTGYLKVLNAPDPGAIGEMEVNIVELFPGETLEVYFNVKINM